MSEIVRRIELGIYDKKEYEKELAWIKARCKEGKDWNAEAFGMKNFTPEEREKQWEFVAKMALILRDIMLGNPELDKIGWHEEALGRNAILGGFQGQRMWTDYFPNGDYAEAILNTTFDWNGKKRALPPCDRKRRLQRAGDAVLQTADGARLRLCGRAHLLEPRRRGAHHGLETAGRGGGRVYPPPQQRRRRLRRHGRLQGRERRSRHETLVGGDGSGRGRPCSALRNGAAPTAATSAEAATPPPSIRRAACP